jgi:hypothetical protein
MEKNPKHSVSTAAKARQIARMLADAFRESQKPRGYITLHEAFRKLEERERREAAHGGSKGRARKARRG